MYEHDMQSMDTWEWVWMTPTLLSWIIPALLAVYLVGTFVGGDGVSGGDRWRLRARFLCRASGMTVAMMLGMVVLASTFTWYEETELAAFAMASGMTLPMAALMRYRGHAWQRSCEMAVAMFLPAVVLLRVVLARPRRVALGGSAADARDAARHDGRNALPRSAIHGREMHGPSHQDWIDGSWPASMPDEGLSG